MGKKNKNKEEKYRLTEWGCLYLVLTDHKINVENISGKEGKEIIKDFMELMIKCGYIKEK